MHVGAIERGRYGGWILFTTPPSQYVNLFARKVKEELCFVMCWKAKASSSPSWERQTTKKECLYHSRSTLQYWRRQLAAESWDKRLPHPLLHVQLGALSSHKRTCSPLLWKGSHIYGFPYELWRWKFRTAVTQQRLAQMRQTPGQHVVLFITQEQI